MQALRTLLANKRNDCPEWIEGRIPYHYKRKTVSGDEEIRLARLGAAKIGSYFEDRLFYSQALIAGACFSGDYDKIVVVSPSQYGKAIADDTPVLTRTGWKAHGELEVGDEVISTNGNFVKVLYVHPKCEMDKEIELENGDKFICHHNHEWIYKATTGRNREKCHKTISVAEMEERGLTLPDGHRKFVVPVREMVAGEEKNLSVPPYVLGAWLGDGATTKGQICSSPKDIAVLDKCREFYPDGSEWAHKETGVITRSFIGLANDLTAYNMCFQRADTPRKHIPEEYLTASIEQRLELLAGLIDTDGYTHLDKRNNDKSRVYFTTSDETLKDSFETLVSTFGWRVSTVEVAPKVSTSGIHGKKPYWVVGFSPTCEIPCVIRRKRTKQLAKQRGIGIVAIRDSKGKQGNCITVEGGEYCIGKHLIPTHNSWLLGRIALIRAYENDREQFITGATADKTIVIQQNAIAALQHAAPEIQNALQAGSRSQLDRLATSVSKTKLAFASGGTIESLTLGDVYTDLGRNKAVGRGGDYFVDEAALVSDESFAELGRREFASIDNEKYLLVMISNPHNPGRFYEELTNENPDKRTFILWMDALTAVEEERFDEEQVLSSDFAKNKSTRQRYLMCDLENTGDSMFAEPKRFEISTGEYKQYFMGVDAAYRGKDNIVISIVSVDEQGLTRVESIEKLKKGEWIEGKTSQDIIKTVSRYAKAYSIALGCVDVGWGVWLTEGLVQAHIPIMGINFGSAPTKSRVRANHYSATNASNKRAEMHLDLQALLDDGNVQFAQEAWEQVKDIFPFVSCERKASGKIHIRDKSKIKISIGRSPDELDAVLLGIHAAIRFCEGSISYITSNEVA